MPTSWFRGRWVMLSALGLLSGCQDYLFSQVCPAGVREVTLTETELQVTPADILFVVDNSGSMAEEQANLARNFFAFIDELTEEGGDYRIGVVTTDQGPRQNGSGGNFCSTPGNITECTGLSFQEHLTDFPFANQGTNPDQCQTTSIDFGCFRSDAVDEGVIVIDESTTTPVARQEVIAQFSRNVQVGTCGSGVERGLEAMTSALAQTNGCNTGFLRDEANLVVVIVSDEPDSSFGSLDGDFEPYIEALEVAKNGDLSRVRVAVIVGSVDGEASTCRVDTSGGATDVCGDLVCDDPPELGNLNRCDQASDCEADEICFTFGTNRCVNPQAVPLARAVLRGDDDPLICGDCTSYPTEDCCSSRPGFGYVSFAETLGARITGSTQSRIDCRVGAGSASVCLVDSICQEEFSATLGTIARELVRSSATVLNPPAVNVNGVVARFVSEGPGGEPQIRPLGPDDFDVSPDGTTLTLSATSTNAVRQIGESLEVFYVTEDVVERELVGACAVSDDGEDVTAQ
ncbi:MAG: vWA domain-containing protein [Myxococcota bacterium]